jgi:hypothetical protein
MGYLTFNTRLNRVVIISSQSQGYFNSVQYQDSHISTYSIKTLVIYLYCAYYALCQLSYSLFIYFCLLLIVVVNLFCSLLDFNLFFVFTFVSLFKFKREKIQFWSWIVFQVFRSCSSTHCMCSTTVPAEQEYYHHLCKSINIIHQTAPTLS